jgi:hypothetical protein
VIGLCVLAGDGLLTLAVTAFTLGWTHSVERTAWEEDWRVTAAGLEIFEARIKGSGAGMEPPAGAQLAGGWWVYVPDLPVLPELVLGASDATAAWSLCAADRCIALGTGGEPVRIRPCEMR